MRGMKKSDKKNPLIRTRSLNSGQASSEKIWKLNKTSLTYFPSRKKLFQTPILFVYSIVNNPNILNLTPNSSVINGFTNQGYDVYLLDFGSPGLEDMDMSIDDYISHVQKAVVRCLHHANTSQLNLFGYCLGGTFAAIYTSLFPENVKNLVLFAAPIDFETLPILNEWKEEWIKEDNDWLNTSIREVGIIPAKFIEDGIKLTFSPISITPKLALINHIQNKDYVERWTELNKWLKGHVPMAGKTFLQMMNKWIKNNELIKNKFTVHGKKVKLNNIRCPLLVITTKNDDLVPKEMTSPIMDVVSSIDKTYHILKGGHISLALKNKKPTEIIQWLNKRST